ncbi:magnesium-translocating P-type ATPase [Deinococcus psychrotolerans]|uniref:Magnesium-transporting ATPase, P-type 1 n=1 Tax=Deinococcus psychrotolerans TaxID=2489213 RepID=A0A3G8YG19_9DEIO|nr:magnesium-translocating P-type ATPase [Deinococcus psychrotolerans]AZI44242.1 magnesium-translocating P-type ATPase [Deinococcus psychrotolerans]
MTADAVAKEAGVTLFTKSPGLSSQAAAELLAQIGPNEISTSKPKPLIFQLLAYFVQPLIAILLIAAVISGVSGDWLNAAIIIVIVLGSIGLDFYQTRRSQVAAESLRSQVAPTATAKRDGVWSELPRSALVPGDLIRLTAGMLVPADAQLLTAADLHVQQSALTGESMPVEKTASLSSSAALDNSTPENPADASNLVFMGSSVVSGRAEALVSATGARTTFGGIVTSLARRAPETEFERGMKSFSLFIVQIVLFLTLFVFAVNTLHKRDPLQSLLFAVALAVGLTPEFLPMITTITLSNGASRMAKKKVIVKNLSSIQNFGQMDTLCSDKTGTLTGGVMTLAGRLNPAGAPSERVFMLAYLNSLFETGITNPLNTAILDTTVSGIKGADPLDQAILNADHPDVQLYRKQDEMPFDFERRRASVVVTKAGESGHLMLTKGAPESVLAVCTTYEHSGEGEHSSEDEQNAGALPLDAAAQARISVVYQGFSAQGLRVIAVARRDILEADQQPAYQASDEHDLTLVGFVTFLDPPLPDAREVLDELRAKGVAVKILTGDNELVARHVCEAVGLDVGRVVLGSELAAMTDTALLQVAEANTVFARVAPAQKNRIILALKARKHVVGYMGDGINDAPSLHTADVGVSVAGATDIARDAADIILLEPGLRVLLSGILEGRRAYGNVMKYLLMGTSSNFGNMFSMAGASVFLPFLPMLPTQILVNNFLYDLAQITIPSDNVDDAFIQKPHHWDIGLIRRFMFWIGPISSVYDFLTFYVLLRIFHAREAEFHTGWFIESLATQTLVIFVIRTFGNPLKSRPSRPLALAATLVVLVGALLPFTPLSGLLGFVPLPPLYFVFLIGATLTYLGLVELVKRRLFGQVMG